MVVLSAVFVAGRAITEVTAANNPGGLEGEEATVGGDGIEPFALESAMKLTRTERAVMLDEVA
jgi:hypothetical protein